MGMTSRRTARSMGRSGDDEGCTSDLGRTPLRQERKRMAVRVGINGFGRIGRLVFRAMAARPEQFEVVAINDLSVAKHLALLLKYDSVHGRFDGTVEAAEKGLVVNGKAIRITAEKDPAHLPWKDLEVRVALESTGFFTNKAGLQKH